MYSSCRFISFVLWWSIGTCPTPLTIKEERAAIRLVPANIVPATREPLHLKSPTSSAQPYEESPLNALCWASPLVLQHDSSHPDCVCLVDLRFSPSYYHRDLCFGFYSPILTFCWVYCFCKLSHRRRRTLGLRVLFSHFLLSSSWQVGPSALVEEESLRGLRREGELLSRITLTSLWSCRLVVAALE